MSQVWLITVPNNKENTTNVYNTVANAVGSKGDSQSFRFEVPELPTGTLDSLMALSDDLNKIGTQVEVSFDICNHAVCFALTTTWLRPLERCPQN